MITSLADRACKQLEELSQLEVAKKEADDVVATRKELENVNGKAVELRDQCLLFSNRLPLEEIQFVELPKILRDLQLSRKKFIDDGERRQVQPLRDISAKLHMQITRINTLWSIYARNLISPYFDLLDLVQILPEVHEQIAILNGLKNKLEHTVSVPPRTWTEVDAFDEALNNMRTRLTQLECLHPEVKGFLQKVHSNQATVADITDAVLRWCRQGEHAKVFRVSFIR